MNSQNSVDQISKLKDLCYEILSNGPLRPFFFFAIMSFERGIIMYSYILNEDQKKLFEEQEHIKINNVVISVKRNRANIYVDGIYKYTKKTINILKYIDK